MPFLGVDAECQVDFDVLNTTNVASYFPGKLLICVPGFAHTEESCMRDCLGIGGDAIMLASGEVDVFRSQAGENMLDFVKTFLGSTMLD